MDEPDIPMLDVGDFEVLDECASDEEQDVYIEEYDNTDFVQSDDDGEHDNPKRRNVNVKHNKNNVSNMDDNSGDNADNILDVSIDVSENEFLENVAKDFSENIEGEANERPRLLRSAKKAGPNVQSKTIIQNPPENPVPKKKPGPKSKTMNIPPTPTPPVKKPIQKITFDKEESKTPQLKKTFQKITFNKEELENKNKENKNENKNDVSSETKIESPNQKKTKAGPQSSKLNVQNKTPAFLKKDLTDEEIMMHFDEIENTVLTSDTFIIGNEQVENQEEIKEEKNDNKQEEEEVVEIEKKNSDDENWDDCDIVNKKKPLVKGEEEEQFAEHEMWYKEKLKAKELQVEDKFTKLAKFIQFSYPIYKKWLDKNDALFGTAICRVEPSKHIPLDQLLPNRWKFICNKKQIPQTSEEEKKQDDNTTENKNTQYCWKVTPGVPDANVDNAEEYPPFVMSVVKIFEEFLQSAEDSYTNEKTDIKDGEKEAETSTEVKKESNATDESESNKEKSNEKDKTLIKNIDGLTLLLRCNRKNELMINVTSKNMTEEFLEKMKDLFENGPGKDCNVKSLYCKRIIKENNVIKTSNSFIWGSEVLEDAVGNVKIQLTPQSNLWTNLAGVEVMANVITDFLQISSKTSVVEIGCGKGLLSLLLAAKCQKIIGLDTYKEVTEAERTTELNEIKNATFVTGKPKVVMNQIDKALENAKAVAIINNNNTYGRSIEIISSIRKMSTVSRLVIITSLTKQSIRAILELTQPANSFLGNPFIPIRACIVDTSPKHPAFEIVISMERRNMRNLLKVSPVPGSVGLISKSKKEAALKQSSGIVTIPATHGTPAKFVKNFKVTAGFASGNKFSNSNFNSSFQGKRPFPKNDDFQSGAKKFKSNEKSLLGLGPNIRPNPMFGRDEGDLRERLSNSRIEPVAIAQEMQEQKKLLDAAKEKLTGVTSSVDVETVKKLQEMLNLAIEKTNKLQSQLPPRSVWDRIAPADSGDDKAKNTSKGGRFVKETGPKEIVVTTSNDRDIEEIPQPKKKYHNVPPLEPDIMPVGKVTRLKVPSAIQKKPSTAPYQKPGPNRFQNKKSEAPISGKDWGRGKPHPPLNSEKGGPSRWGRPVSPRRSSPPRQMRWSPPPRQSSPRRALSPPPTRRGFSPPGRRPVSPVRRPVSPPRRPISPLRRPASPGAAHTWKNMSDFRIRRNSPPRGRIDSPPRGRIDSPPRGRRDSPPRRPLSPPHNFRNSPPRMGPPSRQKSPPPRRYADEWDIPSRGAIVDGGWAREKEKTSWGPQPTSSGWNQGGDNGRFRSENDKWGNGPGGSWDSKTAPQQPQNNNPPNRWKETPPSLMSGTNWDVQTKAASMRDNRHDFRQDTRHEPRHEQRIEPRHEPRVEPRHDSRHEQRWETEKFRNDKDDWDDLPEDARDPWGDEPPKETPRWNPPNQSNPTNWSSREKSNDNWSTKPNFPSNNLLGGGPTNMGMNQNIPNSNMNMNMSSQSKGPLWQQPQQAPSNRTWGGPQSNWQGNNPTPSLMSTPSMSGNMGNMGSNVGMGVGLFGLGGNTMNSWQAQPSNFSNYSSRPMNNPFMNSRR